MVIGPDVQPEPALGCWLIGSMVNGTRHRLSQMLSVMTYVAHDCVVEYCSMSRKHAMSSV